jgi:hypothetical protein
MAELAAIATIASGLISASGTISAGKAQEAAAKQEALALEAKGLEEQAAAQREGEEYERKKDLAQSTLTARAASSGFTATDPTALALADEIERYGTYQQQMAQYGGESRRTGLNEQARFRRQEGKAARKAANISAVGTIIGSIGSMASKYNPPSSSGGSSLRYGGTGYR